MVHNRKAALGFIFITVLLDVVGFGIIIPVIPKLIAELTGEGLSQAARYGGWLMFAFSLMQFLFAPVLEGLSDKFGRRPILLLALLGLSVDCVLQAWAPTIAWLFLGRILAGVLGASYTTASAYIADITEPDKRSEALGIIGAAFGLGFIIGPMIGGFTSQWGIRVPFILAAIVAFLNFLYGLFILPESLKQEHRRDFEWRRANPIGTFVHLKKYPVIFGTIASLVCVYLASYSVQSNWPFYVMYEFGWNEVMVGYSLATVGLLIALVQGVLIRFIIPRIGQVNTVYVGLVLYFLGLVLFGFATKGWMMFAILVPYCVGTMAGPAVQGIISSQVGESEQGELQGALTSLISITSIIGPPFMTNLFTFFTSSAAPIQFSGAPFIMGAILVLLSIYLAYRTLNSNLKGLL
jgi:DHA1 family tetracycline resistance protein-like MFS transporter